MNGLDLVPSDPVSPGSLAKAKILVDQNVGIETAREKWMMLCREIISDGWSEERFDRTLRWFLRTKKFPDWKIADWFEYGVPLFPFAWVRTTARETGMREIDLLKSLDVYLVDGVRLYKWKDGVDLPLERGDG